MKRTVKIVLGLALVGYGLYSHNYWYLLGILPLISGIVNWCPMKTGCENGQCRPGDPSADEVASSCCSTEIPEEYLTTATVPSPAPTKDTTIKILGTGCKSCVALEQAVREAVQSLQGVFKIEKVEDVQDIMAYQVVRTPALVINEVVRSSGRVLKPYEVQALLRDTSIAVDAPSSASQCCSK